MAKQKVYFRGPRLWWTPNSFKVLFLFFRTHSSVARIEPSVWCVWSFNLSFPERKVRLLPYFIGESPSPREDSAWSHPAGTQNQAVQVPLELLPLSWRRNSFQENPMVVGLRKCSDHTPPPLRVEFRPVASAESNTTGGGDSFWSSSIFILLANLKKNNTLIWLLYWKSYSRILFSLSQKT